MRRWAMVGGLLLSATAPAGPGRIERIDDDFERGLCVGSCRGAAWAIAQQIGGRVSVEPAPGRGGRALVARAGPKRGGTVAKADVVARIAPLRAGGTIRVGFSMLVPAGTPLDSLQLVDLECAGCGEGGNPGIRLYLRRGRLRIDRSKIGVKHAWTRDDAPALVAGRWHRIDWTARIGDDGQGAVRVRLDGREVLAASGATAAHGAVDRVQIGITANSNAVPATAWFDDVSILIER